MPPHSRITQRILTWIKWSPFVFIIGLIAYAFLVLIDLQVRYNIVQQHKYFTGTFNVFVTCALAGLSLWSFVVAVFKSPGHPHAIDAERGRGWDVRPVALQGNGERDAESRWERNQRKREEETYRVDDDDEEEEQASRTHSSSNDAGWRSKTDTSSEDERHSLDADGPSVPLLTGDQASAVTNAFERDGPAGLLPGQPQVPSRTGRAQLEDFMTVVSHARQQRDDGRVFLSGLQVKNTGARRWCHKCACEKPDRAHHCSTCGICVLRMDHHCPWLASRCIGLRNHKAFFLFLVYTSLFCVFAAQMAVRGTLRWVEEEPQGYETSPISWAAVAIEGFIFGLALIPFTAYHAYLILRNRTTLESMEGAGRVRISMSRSPSLPARESVSERLRRLAANQGEESGEAARSESDPREQDPAEETWRRDEQLTREERRALKRANKLNIYDMGVRNNWCAVMGPQWPLWLIPVGEPESDGHGYEVNVSTLQKLEEATASIRGASQARASLNDGQTRCSSRPMAANRAIPAPLRVSSIRGKARNDPVSANDLNQSKTSSAPIKAGPLKNAHGIAAWGASPRRDFVLYDVRDDDDEESGVLNTNGAAPRQQDADVWSS